MTPVRYDIIAINPQGHVHALCDADAAPDLIGRFTVSALRRGDSLARVPEIEAVARYEAFLRSCLDCADVLAVVDAGGEVRS